MPPSEARPSTSTRLNPGSNETPPPEVAVDTYERNVHREGAFTRGASTARAEAAAEAERQELRRAEAEAERVRQEEARARQEAQRLRQEEAARQRAETERARQEAERLAREEAERAA